MLFGYRFPWTDLHTLNLDWILEKVKNLEARALPEGGEEGQVLVKTATGYEWRTL